MQTVILVASRNRDELQALLHGSLGGGISVTVFDSLAAAFPEVFDLDPVLALLDGRSLGQSELGLIEALKAAFPAMRVILVFGRDQRDLAALAIRHGADVYLPEPYYLDEFAEVLRREFHGALRRTRRALDQKMDALVSFVESLAPEVNNPLTTIRGFLQILLAGDAGAMSDAEIAEIYGLMDKEAKRIAKIVQELEDFSRTRKPKRLPVDIPDLIGQAIAETRAETDSAIPIDADVEKAPGEGMLDRLQILSALKSLLRFLIGGSESPNGRIALRAGPGDEAKSLSIHLEGTETAAAGKESDKVFIPLRTRKLVRFKEELGLASAYGIIRGHGGRISTTSRGSRTGFQVDLPCG